MPRHLHFAHMLPGSSRVKQGTTYEAGFQFGRVGKSGTSVAHVHFEIRRNLYGGVNFYPYRKGRKFVVDNYENPLEYLAKPGILKPMVFDHFGYNFLDRIGFNSFHPGTDLNWGYGDQDLGKPLWLPQRAKCVYVGQDSGWGLHALFETVENEKPLIHRVNEALRAAGSIVDAKRSDYWQQRVANGDKRDFMDLTNAIKWRMQNRRYPHEDRR